MKCSGMRKSAAVLVCLLPFAIARADSPRLNDLVTPDLSDFQATVAVVKSDQSELEKINRDFGMAYRLRDLTLSYKEPNKLRMEGRIGVLILNGSVRYYKIPQLRITKREDLKSTPSQKRSLLDLGLLTPSTLECARSRFLKSDRIDETPTAVFEITFKGDDSARYVAWVDPKTHVVLKREWYGGDQKLRATFYYKNLQEVKPGIWMPTRIEVRNAEGAIAGITEYRDLRVNEGMDDSLFDVSA